MSPFKFILVSVFFVDVLNIVAQRACPKLNEELKSCGACDGTCDIPNPICSDLCRPASCGCINGTVRNKYNKCIPVKECCPEPNEELKLCGACDGTCNITNPFCPEDCGPASCGCIEGTVRNDYNICIPVEECCPEPNEELKFCGACDGTCDIPNPVCSDLCRPASCGCINGTVRNKYNKCIPVELCCLKPNEELIPCGACDGTCNTPNPFCTLECGPDSCGCIEGTVRNDYNICIPVEECCPEQNEELKPCGACDRICSILYPICPEDCGPASCGCIEGTVRNDYNICIPVEECCPEPNEELKFCGACDGTCSNPNPICPFFCISSSCGCISGTVRNKYNKCIPVEECCPEPNEELKPCGACDGTCDVPNPICTEECGPASCGCVNGTVRNKCNKCIPLTDCCY
ncbi:keratin-associated protein 5-1-like isoform X2 [Centruroides sculpturatus]|uniref:keratin-associated protein 5-1-like isoform X2 n=1 Tax=Centruroides sculpturatus TaxID=218467 RepID=UPI000C6CABF3|nr:keratin-associated protein 5-1-like isoform X2 [Centruroides sculpturatus]